MHPLPIDQVESVDTLLADQNASSTFVHEEVMEEEPHMELWPSTHEVKVDDKRR